MLGKIINGDSNLLLEDLVRETENAVIVTDPPFNVDYHYNEYKDRMPEDEYFAMLAYMFRLAPSVVVHYPESLHRLSIEMREVPVRVVSWVYPSNTQRQHRDIAFYRLKPRFDLVRRPYKNMNDKRVKALFERTGGAKSYDWVECNQVKNVNKEKTAHPCQMPLSLMRDIVRWCGPGVTVIDPFAGSGTTTLACELEGVPWVAIDVSKEYCDIIQERIERGF